MTGDDLNHAGRWMVQTERPHATLTRYTTALQPPPHGELLKRKADIISEIPLVQNVIVLAKGR